MAQAGKLTGNKSEWVEFRRYAHGLTTTQNHTNTADFQSLIAKAILRDYTYFPAPFDLFSVGYIAVSEYLDENETADSKEVLKHLQQKLKSYISNERAHARPSSLNEHAFDDARRPVEHIDLLEDTAEKERTEQKEDAIDIKMLKAAWRALPLVDDISRSVFVMMHFHRPKSTPEDIGRELNIDQDTLEAHLLKAVQYIKAFAHISGAKELSPEERDNARYQAIFKDINDQKRKTQKRHLSPVNLFPAFGTDSYSDLSSNKISDHIDFIDSKDPDNLHLLYIAANILPPEQYTAFAQARLYETDKARNENPGLEKVATRKIQGVVKTYYPHLLNHSGLNRRHNNNNHHYAQTEKKQKFQLELLDYNKINLDDPVIRVLYDTAKDNLTAQEYQAFVVCRLYKNPDKASPARLAEILGCPEPNALQVLMAANKQMRAHLREKNSPLASHPLLRDIRYSRSYMPIEHIEIPHITGDRDQRLIALAASVLQPKEYLVFTMLGMSETSPLTRQELTDRLGLLPDAISHLFRLSKSILQEAMGDAHADLRAHPAFTKKVKYAAKKKQKDPPKPNRAFVDNADMHTSYMLKLADSTFKKNPDAHYVLIASDLYSWQHKMEIPEIAKKMSKTQDEVRAILTWARKKYVTLAKDKARRLVHFPKMDDHIHHQSQGVYALKSPANQLQRKCAPHYDLERISTADGMKDLAEIAKNTLGGIEYFAILGVDMFSPPLKPKQVAQICGTAEVSISKSIRQGRQKLYDALQTSRPDLLPLLKFQSVKTAVTRSQEITGIPAPDDNLIDLSNPQVAALYQIAKDNLSPMELYTVTCADIYKAEHRQGAKDMEDKLGTSRKSVLTMLASGRKKLRKIVTHQKPELLALEVKTNRGNIVLQAPAETEEQQQYEPDLSKLHPDDGTATKLFNCAVKKLSPAQAFAVCSADIYSFEHRLTPKEMDDLTGTNTSKYALSDGRKNFVKALGKEHPNLLVHLQKEGPHVTAPSNHPRPDKKRLKSGKGLKQAFAIATQHLTPFQLYCVAAQDLYDVILTQQAIATTWKTSPDSVGASLKTARSKMIKAVRAEDETLLKHLPYFQENSL